MNIGTLIIITVLTLVSGYFILEPLRERKRTSTSNEGSRYSALQVERDRILTSLEDLAMDHTMGKVLEEDYRLQRRELVALGAGVLREIDELVDEESELVVSTDLEAELEAQVAKLRAARSVSTGGFCSACGAEAVAGDRFCVRCGEPFHDEESET